jgi:acetylglutamate kinase
MTHDYSTPLVVKYGGNALGLAGELLVSLVALHKEGRPVVLVHGGGPEIDRWLAERDTPTHRIEGLRVTDAQTLEVTEAVLCATINKRLVRACAALGAKAAGISGEDGRTLIARRAYGSSGEDLGFVGAVTQSDPQLIELLLGAGYLPVVAPLAISEDGTQAYNVNADLAAAAIAGALGAQAFVLVTNVTRVLRDVDDPSSAIDHLTLDDARAFAASPDCAGGMLPKMQAAITAIESGSSASYICSPQRIEDVLAGNATIVSGSAFPA